MKGIILLATTLCLLVLSLTGCANRQEEYDFAINNWSSSIGAVNENSLDVFDAQKFSFQFFLTSATGRLNEVKTVVPIFSDNVMYRVISNGLPQIRLTHYDIVIGWYAVANTTELTKEQIFQEFEPFVTAINVILEDDTEYLIKLPKFNLRERGT